MSATARSLHDFVATAQAAVLGDVPARRQVAALLGGMGVERMSELLLSVCAGVDLRGTSTSRPAGFVDPDRMSDAQCWYALHLYETEGRQELPVLVGTVEHYRRQVARETAAAGRSRRARISALDKQARGLRVLDGGRAG